MLAYVIRNSKKCLAVTLILCCSGYVAINLLLSTPRQSQNSLLVQEEHEAIVVTTTTKEPAILQTRRRNRLLAISKTTAQPSTTSETTAMLLTSNNSTSNLLIDETTIDSTAKLSSNISEEMETNISNAVIALPETTTKQHELLVMCQDPPPELIGEFNVTFETPTTEEIIARNPNVKPGGRFQPLDCASLHSRVAIVVPYRDRDVHLRTFLNHMHPILQRQQLNYVIIVVEQAGNDTFNKALLMNVAYKESLKMVDQGDVEMRFQCYIFHDVDLLTEDDRGLYACRDKPMHLSEYLNHLNYEPYDYIDVLFGGVVAIPRRHFELVNGYSNVYFGWGAEDEDMRRRLAYARIRIIKAEKDKYRYKMWQHNADTGNPRNEQRLDLLYNATIRMNHDGLNSLTYKLLKRSDMPLYTHLLVEFNKEDVLKASSEI